MASSELWRALQDVSAELDGTGADAPGGHFVGPLLVASARGSAGNPVRWALCPSPASYAYQPSRVQTLRAVADHPPQQAGFWPLARTDARDAFSRAQHVPVELTVRGSFVLDRPPSQTALRGCPRASHIVERIVVGAYRTSSSDDARTGELSRGATAAFGEPSTCASETPGRAKNSRCAVPLALVLRDLDRRASGGGNAEWRSLDDPDGRLAAITSAWMSGQRSVSTRLAGFAQCQRGFKPTGRLLEDLHTLGDRCGRVFGMRAVGAPMAGRQAATAAVDEWALWLKRGYCYRVVAVSGDEVLDLDIGLYSENDVLLARDVRPANWGLLGPISPVCVDETAYYRFMVSVELGGGPFVAQLWELPPAHESD